MSTGYTLYLRLALLGALAAAPVTADAQGAPAPTLGARVEVEWNGSWYPATVIELGPGRFKIHYDGHDSSWDEWVPPARMRSPATASARSSSSSMVPPPASSGALLVPPPSSLEAVFVPSPSEAIQGDPGVISASMAPANAPSPQEGARGQVAPSGRGGAMDAVFTEPPRPDDYDLVRVQNPQPIDPRLVGTWKIRIPTDVSYSTDGAAVYRRIEAGTNMDELRLDPDGSYVWGGVRGRAPEVRWKKALRDPEPDPTRWFHVSDGTRGYMVRYVPEDDSLTMIFDTGGFLANGTRIR